MLDSPVAADPNRPRSGTASITGRVARTDGQPIVGAQLRLVNADATTRSDEQGNFVLAGLPAGAQELEARHLGYGIVRRPVELSSLYEFDGSVQIAGVRHGDCRQLVLFRQLHNRSG